LPSVHRRPHLAKKIPIVSGIPLDGESKKVAERWRGTTPHGRELIRKKLWELERQLMTQDFNDHWPRIASMLPDKLFSRAVADQDENIGLGISEHLTHTHQWAAYRDSVTRCARAAAEMRWCPGIMEHVNAVEFFKLIAEASESRTGLRSFMKKHFCRTKPISLSK
jgi:hypothetical protein